MPKTQKKVKKKLNQQSNPDFTLDILKWFQENARNLPWRNNPTVYNVWLSEIMLQQTRVVAVLDYHKRFLEALPTIADLAACPEEKLMKLWEGLGYYNRARNLQKAAIQVVENHNGIFPQTYEDIRALSGIGDYTAGAIASTVFGLPHPAVDGNVLRVVARITGNTGDITTPTMKKEVTQWVTERMPTGHVGAYNQALMELGALICLPNGPPLCNSCPVQNHCHCGNNNNWQTLPVKKAKKPRKLEHRQVYLIYQKGKLALRKRPSKGLLANLWEFPHALTEENPWQQWNLKGNPQKITTGKHIFTHIEWRMEGFSVTLEETTPTPEHWIFATPQELKDTYAIPSAFSFLDDFLQ